MMRSMSAREACELALGGFGGGIGFFEVADDHDVLVVEGVGWRGVVEAAGVSRPAKAAPTARVSSAPACLDLLPEGVDARVPLVRDLLEGLVGLLLHHLELGAGNELGNGAAEFRATGHIAAAGEDERWDGDLGQAVGRVVLDEGVEEPLQVLGRLLVGEGEHLLDDLLDGSVVVRPRRVDPHEEPLEERALARRDLDQPADEEEPDPVIRSVTGQVLCKTRLRTSSG